MRSLRISPSLHLTRVYRHVALESRVLAGYVAGASMLMILAQAAFQSSFGRMIRQRLSGTYILAKSRESMAPTGTYLSLHGGWVIILYQALRLVANMTLVVLVIMTALFSERSAMGDVALIIASVSVSLHPAFYKIDCVDHSLTLPCSPFYCSTCRSSSPESSLSMPPSLH